MCGIAGALDSRGSSSQSELLAVADRMAATLAHRGPDAAGTWADERAGVALGFRRLSIIDLSPAGHQPMVSACERFVLVFNGEVYNFPELRQELTAAGERFRGHSDTEVLLAAITRFGVREAACRANGMFAFAVWDRERRVLTLARDRLGEKPLYYGWSGNTFVFGSELKAMRAHPGFEPNIDRDVVAAYLRHNYVPSPWSIYSGVYKVAPGTLVSISTTEPGARRQETFWDPVLVARQAAEPTAMSDEEATDALQSLLRDSVRMRMVADVPLGAFLSGGIDSSTIVALMQECSERPVRTFTIGFSESGYDEAGDAKRVAAHLGTDHTELYVSPEDAQAVIPQLPQIYDEPFADSSQIPTFLVSRLARGDVTVALSGDGGDELFGGYTRYLLFQSRLRWIGAAPHAVRRRVAALLNAVPPERWEIGLGALQKALPSRVRVSRPGHKVHRLAELLAARPGDLYRQMMSYWPEPAALVPGSTEPTTAFTRALDTGLGAEAVADLMLCDMVSYLPDDILVKVDRASMAVSLEARVPILDHRVAEFAWMLPLAMKIRRGEGKWILRRVLERYVPTEVTDRPKMGFGVPIAEWLRGPLASWAGDLLSEAQLRRDGYLAPEPVTRLWREHLVGDRDWSYQLWGFLMFGAWLERHRDRSARE